MTAPAGPLTSAPRERARESLADSLIRCLGLLADEPARFARAAASWHAHWCLCVPQLTLADAVLSRWPSIEGGRADGGHPFVVCTGGEPLLQLDDAAIDALHARGFTVAVETNGTQPAPRGIDHICVSPKADAPLVLQSGQELKLVFPQIQPDAQPERFAGLAFEAFYLQPMDDANPEVSRRNTEAALAYCLDHPKWRLSLQTHKLLGIR